jgi:hypothetical protein
MAMAATVLKGATRCVVLTRRWAIKFPRLVSWRLFMCGLLANMQEREFSRAAWPELCPVLFALPGGWLVVMPRCVPMSSDEWHAYVSDDWRERADYVVPVEMKLDSFGWLGDRIVAVDYGS